MALFVYHAEIECAYCERTPCIGTGSEGEPMCADCYANYDEYRYLELNEGSTDPGLMSVDTGKD